MSLILVVPLAKVIADNKNKCNGRLGPAHMVLGLSTLGISDRVFAVRDGQVEALAPLADISNSSDFFRRALDAGTLDLEPAQRQRPPEA